MSNRSTRISLLSLAVVLLIATMICSGIIGHAANSAPPRPAAIGPDNHPMVGAPSHFPETLISQVGSNDQNAAETVYITKTGDKYHVAGCRSLAKSCIPIALDDAQKKGYTPCRMCKPPQ